MQKPLRAVIAIAFCFSIISPTQHANAVNCSPNITSYTGNGSNGTLGAVYTVYTFTADTTCDWTVPVGITNIDSLVIGGGGGGGSWVGGGAGAGAMVENFAQAVTPGSVISVTVGSGGLGHITSDRGELASRIGTNGSNSSFGSTTAVGGGVGGRWDLTAGNGGSGGGGGGNTGLNGGTALNSSYGKNGGAGFANAGTYSHPTGGGGGAGAAGEPGTFVTNSSGSSGAGGAGKSSSINGTATTYAGGGGGGCHGNGPYPCSSGAGGSGGGGAGDGWIPGDTIVNGVDGAVNTGGGGGGSGGPHVQSGTSSQGGNGGSGIVILRHISDTTPPTLSATSFTVNENLSAPYTAATITLSESSTISSIAGADSASFTLLFPDSTTVVINFNASPDFESPIDSGGGNDYQISFVATDLAGNFGTQAITITVTDVVDTSAFNGLSLAGAVTSASYRTAILITADISVASKVTFRLNGKVIPGCKRRLATGSESSFTVSCNWRPSMRGYVTLVATANPVEDGIPSATASPIKVFVNNRSGPRGG